MPSFMGSLVPTRALALLTIGIVAGCGGVPLDDLKSSEFRIVRTAQKPIWAYSQCLAEHFQALRRGPAPNQKLDLKVNVTRAGIELMAPDGGRADAPPSYWYVVHVQPVEEGVRTSAWVCKCMNPPSPQQMLRWIDDAIQICGSESV